jgi:hypothetical protein
MRIGMPTISWAKTRYTGSNAGDGLLDHSPAKTTQPSRFATMINRDREHYGETSLPGVVATDLDTEHGGTDAN